MSKSENSYLMFLANDLINTIEQLVNLLLSGCSPKAITTAERMRNENMRLLKDVLQAIIIESYDSGKRDASDRLIGYIKSRLRRFIKNFKAYEGEDDYEYTEKDMIEEKICEYETLIKVMESMLKHTD